MYSYDILSGSMLVPLTISQELSAPKTKQSPAQNLQLAYTRLSWPGTTNYIVTMGHFNVLEIFFSSPRDFAYIIVSALHPSTHARTQSNPIPVASCPPNLHNRPDRLPAHRARFHLFRTRLARGHMPTLIEQRVHFFLVADPTELHILVGDLKLHRSFAVTLSLAKPANVHVSCFRIDHFALAVRLVVFPLTRVCVTVGKGHDSVPRHGPRNELSRVGISRHGDLDAVAVRAAVFLSRRKVRATVVRLETAALVVRGVALMVKPREKVDGVRVFAFCFQPCDSTRKAAG